MNSNGGPGGAQALKEDSDSRIMDADYWRRFEYSTNLLHYYAWWLYYFGIIVFFCSISFFTLCILQLQMIDGMAVLEGGSGAKMHDLKGELEKIVE